jgi:hypothetical protein
MMMKQSKRWVAGLLLLVAMVLSACASSDDAAQSLSKGDEGDASKKEIMETSSAADSAAGTAEKAAAPAADGSGSQITNDAASAGIGMTAAAVEGVERKIVYHANLTMEVTDFDKASTSLQNVIHQSGAYTLKFSDSVGSGEIGASYTIKVPADGFMPFLEKLEKIDHSLFERQMQGTDVSEEYVDLEARLHAKQIVEGRLLGFMDKAQKADDLVKFSDQLASVQEEMERIKGRIRYLNNNVAYSTVELRLYQPSPGISHAGADQPLGARMAAALSGSTRGLSAFVQSLLVLAAGALPVLLILAIAAIPITWFIRRGRRGKPILNGGINAETPKETE